LGFHTCKLTDGLRYFQDPSYQAQTNLARQFGVPVLGAYHVLWGNRDIGGQVDWFIERLDALTPYWRTVPFVLQSDCEPFGYNVKPTISQINSFGDLLIERSGLPSFAYTPYAPAWSYGGGLTMLRYGNYWGSNYGSNPAVPYRDAYPGDSSSRWAAAAVKTIILQYGSVTDIGDANAYRGDLASLLNTIGWAGGSPSNGGSSMATDAYNLLDGGIRSQTGKAYETYTDGNGVTQPIAGIYNKLFWLERNLSAQLDTVGKPTPAELATAVKAALLDPEVMAALAAALAGVHISGTFQTD